MTDYDHRLTTLKVMLQAQLSTWEQSLESWKHINQSGTHDFVVGDRTGRIAQVRDTLKMIEELTK